MDHVHPYLCAQSLLIKNILFSFLRVVLVQVNESPHGIPYLLNEPTYGHSWPGFISYSLIQHFLPFSSFFYFRFFSPQVNSLSEQLSELPV